MNINILKCIFLFLAIWLSLVNFSRLYGKNDIPVISFILQAAGITGFIVIQFNLLQL